MAVELVAPILTGAFALAVSIGGVLLSNRLGRQNDERRLAAEDARRWLGDRRRVYVTFLTLAESMLREIDGIGCFLSYDGSQPIDAEDDALIQEGFLDYVARWEEELQPALLEVQLMASPAVADLADRMSGALLEVTTPIRGGDGSSTTTRLGFRPRTWQKFSAMPCASSWGSLRPSNPTHASLDGRGWLTGRLGRRTSSITPRPGQSQKGPTR